MLVKIFCSKRRAKAREKKNEDVGVLMGVATIEEQKLAAALYNWGCRIGD